MKGTLHKTENGWQVSYSVINSLRTIPIHPYLEKYYFLDEDSEGGEVEFEMDAFWETGLEQVINVAKLKKPNSSSKIVELKGDVNLEEIPKEQLEKERNPAYEYFDVEEISDEEIQREARKLAGIQHGRPIDDEERYYKNYQKYDGIIIGMKWYREQMRNKKK